MERGLYPLFQPCKRIPRCINQGTEEVQQLMRLFVISRDKKGGMRGGEERDGNSHDPVYTLYTLHPVIR